uniref:LexA family protein n=1 Tax=Succinivibrio sp. TaxID=2053619 RepID=UPI003FF0AD6B
MKKSLIRCDVELQEGPFKGQDLNTYLYMNLPSVYLFRMSSNVMHEDGILEGDVVIVDRSLLIENGDYVVMSINGTFLLRQFLDGREPRLV